MKLKIKFIGFFTLGLILFLFYMTLMMVFSLEVIMPWMELTDNVVAFIVLFLFTFFSGGIFFSIWFVQPILSMMKCISELSCGNYNQSRNYTSLKKRHWLYIELMADLDELSVKLQQAEIERQNLEHAKQNWVRGISHDIKTPLSYIVGYSSLLLSPDHSWESTEQQNFLSQIHQKGQYIESLINSMNLSFRLEDNVHPIPLQIHNFDLIPFMENLMADMLNQEPSKKFAISFESMDAHLDIEADDKLLYRAIANLIGNAMQHNPAGADIKIKIKQSGQGVDILVCDNGVGMSQEAIDTLFDKYHDNQNTQNGKIDYASGLGLSIVKSIVDANHGELLVYSKENVETIFTIRFPAKHIEQTKEACTNQEEKLNEQANKNV